MSGPSTRQMQHRLVDGALGDLIPAEMRSPCVCWREEPRPGSNKPKKPPIDPTTGENAQVNDRTTWGTFDQARARYEADDDIDGIGYMFTADGSLVGIDLDNVIDPETGEIMAEADEILRSLDSYAELSPSGSGLHIIVRGELPDEWRTRTALEQEGPLDDTPQIEVYDSDRYFSVTGDVLSGYETITDGGEALSAIGDRYLAPDDAGVQDGTNTHVPSETDIDVESTIDPDAVNTDVDPTPYRIRRTLEEYAAVGKEPAQRALDLWHSSASDTMGHPSSSEADIEFVGSLAFWCRNDERLIFKCVQASDRYREEWDRETYREPTIETAVENNHQVFRGRYVRD